MRNWKKRLGNIGIISCGILLFFFQLAIIFSIYVYTKKSVVKGVVENFISEKSGSRITIDHIDYRLSPFVIKADSITYSSTNDQSETDVFLKRLTLYGDIKKILRTKELSFSTAKVNGARVSIKLQPGLRERSLDDIRGYLSKISNFKQYIQEVDIQDSTFVLTSKHSEIKLQSLRSKLSATGKKNEFDVTLTSDSLSLMDHNRDFSLLTSFQGKGKITLPSSPSLNADFSFGQIALNFAGERFSLDDTTFSLNADLSSERISFDFSNFTTNLPPFALVTGTVHWSKGRDTSFVVTPYIQVKDLDKTVQFLSPRIFPELTGFKLTGTADIEGEYAYIKGSEGESNYIDGKLRLNSSKLVYIEPHLSMSNTVAGMLYLKGDPAHPDVSGLLQISKGNLEWKNLRIQNMSMRFPISVQNNFRVKIPGLRGEMNVLSYQLGNEKIGFDQVRFEGEGSYDPKQSRLICDDLDIQIPSLPPLSFTADVSLKPAGERSLHLKSSNLNFASLSSVFSQFLPQNIAQWEPDASIDLEMSVQKPLGEMLWTTHSKIHLTDIQFHNPSFTIAGESLAPRIVLRSTYSPYHDRMPFSLEFYLEQGEFLWDDYYIDWSKNPFSAKISGIYEADSTRFPDLTANVSLPTFGEFSASGSLSAGPQFQMNVNASASSSHLQSLYTFLSLHEDSEDVAVNLEGKVLLEFNLEKSSDFLCLQGRFKIDDGIFFRKDQAISLHGINARIPFYYQNKNIPGQDNGSNFSEGGSLSVDTFNLSTFFSNPLYMEITSKANEFHLLPVTLDVFGGHAVFGETIVSLVRGFSNISGSSSFTLDNLDLSRIPLKSELFKFDGTAGADFPLVEIHPDHISTQGQGYIHAFDGEISIHDFGIKEPFSKNRTITCDIDYSGLNLEKLTNSTPYGRVTGVIKGEIKNLAISYGQPEGFSLSLETEKRKGIPKKFSTAAIRDLEILGTGGTTSMSSAKFLSRFVSEFRYSKIGIFCSLKNDVFTLRGTVKDDGTEYLVKNAWIFGISVINRKPQNQISFKDMVSRIRRIHQSQESR